MARIDFLGNPDFRVNEYGRIALIHKAIPNLIAELPYAWHTELVILDETDGRRVVGHKPYSYFDDDDWSVVTKEEYDQVRSNVSEVKQIRRRIRLEKLL